MINKLKKYQISFPITYNFFSITEEQFLLAIEKLMQKFDLKQERAMELAEDIIKAMITENKPSHDLGHEIDGLDFADWHFLRDKSIAEVIASQNHGLSRFR
ncbi:MAG: hypothetical protein WC860_04555 [Candidatus Margulisiibacteriota bacterium]|jgi:hypothetical protein